MQTFLGAVQIEARAPRDDVLLMLEIIVQDLLEVQDLRLAVDQREVDDAERVLQLRVLIQVVQHDVRVDVLLELDDDVRAVAVRFVAQIRNALDALFVHEVRDALHEPRLVDLIRDLGHDDAAAVLRKLFDLGLCADDQLASAGTVRLRDAAPAEDRCAGRKVRTGNIAHQLVDRDVGIVDQRHKSVDRFAEVVRRHVRRHTDRDAVTAVYQQVRETRGQHGGLLLRAVEVRLEIDRVLVDVAHHFHCHLRKTRFGVTHRRRAVAVGGTEVALPLDERIARVEILRKTHHRVVYGGIAVRMVFTHAVADDTRALTRGLVGRDAELFHGVQDAAVHRLHAVAHIGERAARDD